MFNFSKENIMMYDAITRLDSFPYASGGEGCAYFLDDNYVLKRYTKKDDSDFDAKFDDYCKEMKKFHERGLNVPNIYAWTKIPNFNRRVKPENRYDYYILEERIKGRQLFYGYLEEVYDVCKKLCSKDEFLHVINSPDDDRLLFREILKAYVKDYQKVNEYLASAPESMIDKFLYDCYVMCLDGIFSKPDFFPANVLFQKDKQFSIIDNNFEDRIAEGRTTKKFADSHMTSGLIWLFFYNNYVTNPREFVSNDGEARSYLVSMKEKVAKPCKAAMIKMIKRMNSVCMSPKFTDSNAFVRDYLMISDMLSKADAKEIFDEFEKKFD